MREVEVAAVDEAVVGEGKGEKEVAQLDAVDGLEEGLLVRIEVKVEENAISGIISLTLPKLDKMQEGLVRRLET